MIGALVAVDVHPGRGLRAAVAESFAALCVLLDRAPALPLVRCEVLLYVGRRQAGPARAFQQRYLDALQVCYRVACAPGEWGLIASDDAAAVVSTSTDGLAVQTAMGVTLPQQEATRARRCYAPCSPWCRRRRPAHRRATTAAPLGAHYAHSRRRAGR
jgi:hypothetical protein